MRNRRNTRTQNRIKEILTNKIFIRVAIILITIIFISTGIISYRKYNDNKLLAKQKEELEKQTEEIFTSLENPQEEVEAKDTTAKLSIVGDILCGTEMIEDAQEEETYNFNKMFKNVSAITQKSDITIGTLETNFTNENYSGMGKYNSPIEFLKSIKETGIDLVSLAHNHELDYGVNGLNTTISKIEENNISITGIKNNADNSDKEFSGNIKNVKGIKIAFLAYTYGLSNSDELTEDEKSNANIYSEEKVSKDIEYAKKNSQYIITIMHWGDVNNSDISSWQNDVTNYLVNSGVDMILGSHPSVVEPMEIKQNSEGKNVLVAYSLGNYISSLKYENADVELVLNVQIFKKSDEDKASLQKVDYTPLYVLDNGEKSENRYVIEDMKKLAIDYTSGNSENISRNTYNKLITQLNWLEGIIKNQ